jgi:hypothetical protein
MRSRVAKAYNLYTDNLRLFDRLSNAKSTLPNVEALVKQSEKHEKLLRRISHYETKKSGASEAI